MTDAPILWLTRWAPYPPLHGGDMIYSRDLLESLAHAAPVEALAFAREGVTPPSRDGLNWTFINSAPPHRALSLLSTLPNVAFRHAEPAYLEAALARARQARAVVVDFLGLFDVGLKLIARRDAGMGRSRPPVILLQHNHEYAVRSQMTAGERAPGLKAALALDTLKARRLEYAALRACDGVIACTPADAEAFARIAPGTPSVVAMPPYRGQSAPPRIIGPETPRRILLLGSHEAHHKRMVLLHTLEALDRSGLQHDAAVDVVGPGEKASLEARYPGFNFRGYVDDLDAYLATVRLGLIPDEIGGGFKLRALTHAFRRVPMLAVESALNGMGFTPGRDFVAATDVAEAARIAVTLLDDFDRLNAVQASAFQTCQATFDWADRGRDIAAFIDGLQRASA